MWLLSFLVVLFIIVIAMILYANWSSKRTEGQSQGGCPCGNRCPCMQCGGSGGSCRCPYRPRCQGGGGCPFC